MTSDCSLCVSLGATKYTNQVHSHDEVHARQLDLINCDDIFDGKLSVRNGSHHEARTNRKEQTKKSALFRYCRELINIYGKNCAIKCSQCKHSIRSRQNSSKTSSSLVSHACVHLNKDLFACRHCDLKFVSKGGVHWHLIRIHSLSRNSANYIDMMDDHQNQIIDMLKLCFGKAPQKQLSVTAFGKQKKNNLGPKDPILKLAFGCVGMHKHGNPIKCNLCSNSVSNNNLWTAANRLLDHARWHLDKPIFTCLLCQYSTSTQGAVSNHLKCIHSVAKSKQNFKDGSSEHVEEISSMMEDCFGKIKKERPPGIAKEQERSRPTKSKIRTRCGTNTLLAERQLRCTELAKRFQRSGKLQCRICLIDVVVAKERYLVGPMKHALVHFNKILFICHRCSYTSMSKQMIGKHVRSKHGVSSTNGFDDRTDDFHADFMDMLSKCYDWGLEPEKPEGFSVASLIPKKCITNIISKSRGNNLKAARHIRASELIRKHAVDGKIICSICSHPMSILKGTKCQVEHATTHLDRRFWPYRCKLCSHISAYRSCIRSHLKNVHKSKDAGEFEDLSDKFHSEIMEIMSKCFEGSETGEMS